MRLLILGGTKFLGRAAAEAALVRGHELTLFNRGRTGQELFPEAERLRGDRDGDLSALEGREWDAVVDTSGYLPRVVRAAAELLRESGHYVFVSSISAYAEPLQPGADEEAPLHGEPRTEDVSQEYGQLKAACERVVEDVFGDRSARIRAGLIVGPHDPTGRFTYWPHRAARGGDVLAPGSPDRPVQFVDVRDLGGWLVRVAEERIGGAFNATGSSTMGRLLQTCLAVTGSDARLVWVDDDTLLALGAGEWMELPLWIPSEPGMLAVDASRAVAAGLGFRPLEDTVRATLELAGSTATAGLSPQREAELLALASARSGGPRRDG